MVIVLLGTITIVPMARREHDGLSRAADGQVDLSRVLRALADPQRRAVIAELTADPRDSERPCASFPMPVTKSTRTHRWRVLREAGHPATRRRQRDLRTAAPRRVRQRFPGLLDTLTRLAQAGT